MTIDREGRLRADDLVARARERERRGDFGAAMTLFNAAVEADPEHADAWIHLSELHDRSGGPELAIACARRALTAHPDRVDASIALAARCLDCDRVDEAAGAFARVAALAPETAANHFNLGIAHHLAGRNDAALAALDQSCALDRDYPAPRFLRSLILLEEGRFADAWPDYHWRWRTEESPPLPDALPEWDGAPFNGKTMVVLPEGGFGDTIWASRFLPRVKARGGDVILKTKPETRRLLARLDGVDGYVDDDDFDLADFDLLCPALSMPARLGFDGVDPPPPARLWVADDIAAKLEPLLDRAGGRLKVGIVWSGSETFEGHRRRTAPFAHFLALAENPDIQLYSLQKGAGLAALVEQRVGPVIIDAETADFAETAALIERLDLVVMTDSAVAHVGGALGTPVWNLLDYAPYWIYRRAGDETPWYPSMRLFRQARPGDWVELFARVSVALEEAAEAHRAGRWPTPRIAV